MYPTLCDPLDCSPPGSSIHGILQTRTIKWVAISYSNTGFPGGSEVKASASNVGDLGSIPGLGRSPGEGNVYYMCVLVTQLCPTLSDPMDCSPPGYSVYGIFQARTLEWVAMPSSRRSPQTRDQTSILQEDSLLSEPPGKPSGCSRVHNMQLKSSESTSDLH